MKTAKITFAMAAFAAGLLMTSCGGGAESADGSASSSSESAAPVEFDLTEQGIPVIVTGPAGAEVKKGSMNADYEGIKTISWEISKDNFQLEVNMTDVDNEETVADLIASDKELSMEEDGFKIIMEDENGYAYSKDTEYGPDHGLYYVMLKDNRAIEFAHGFNMNEFSLEDITAMFEAAKAAK